MLQIHHFENGVKDVDIALSEAGMDWSVSIDPVVNPRTGMPTSQRAIFRDDTDELLSFVGGKYTLLQNRERFDYLTKFAMQNDFSFAGMGTKGGQIFAQIELGIHNVGGIDPTKRIITSLGSHDGSLEASFHATNIRIVCANTFAMNKKEARDKNNKEVIRFKHTKSIHDRMEKGQVLIELAMQAEANLLDTFDMLTRIKLDAGQFKTYVLDKIYGVEKSLKKDGTERKSIAEETQNQILTFFDANDNDAMPEIRNTAWRALQAVTEHTNHHVRVNKLAVDEKQVKRQFDVIAGNGFEVNNEAFKLITEFAKTQNPLGFSAFSFPSGN